MGSGFNRLRVRREIIARLIGEARREPRIECCGLLAGTGDLIAEMFPAKNALASATAYEIAPEELFRLFRQMRERGLDHLGIYHSHPAADNSPSPTDIERAYYPDAAYFIVSPRPDAPRPVRAFRIRQAIVSECEIEQVDGEPRGPSEGKASILT
jgi:proteasome lid subunit RPN8/RPN11